VQRLKADRVGSAKFSLDVQGKTAVSVRLGH
jgi:hypothetical protein